MTHRVSAVLNADDKHHAAAQRAWAGILAQKDELVTTNYVLLETFALLQNRLGLAAVRQLRDDLIRSLSIEWVAPDVHDAALAAVLALDRRQVSLVDCVSFETMRRLGITRAFAYDPHFEEQGFELVSDPS